MIKTEAILTTSNGREQGFFLKKGYRSQSRNNTLDANRSSNYWDFNRIVNSAWDQADCYRYAKNYVMNSKNSILEIGCGTLIKQNRFYFSNGLDKTYYCMDQENSFKIASQLGVINKNMKILTCDLEQDMSKAIEYFNTNNEKISTILCFDVIEHLFNPSNLLKMIKEVANKDTEIIFSTPERDLKRGKDMMESNKAEHVREWNQEEYSKLMEYFGFSVKEIKIVQDTDMREDCLTTMIVRCGIKQDV